MTFKVIWRQGQGHVRLKVSKMTIFKIYLLRHFSTVQKNSNSFWYWTKISKISLAGFLNFLPVIESHDFKVCQKNQLRPILMKLGMMLEVDERHSRRYDFRGYPRSGSRWGDDLSPLSWLFFCWLSDVYVYREAIWLFITLLWQAMQTLPAFWLLLAQILMPKTR